MITEMAEAQLFFVNVQEDPKGRGMEENSYLAIFADTPKRPLLMAQIAAEGGLVFRQPSPKMRELFLKRLDGKELPAMGGASLPIDMPIDVQDI